MSFGLGLRLGLGNSVSGGANISENKSMLLEFVLPEVDNTGYNKTVTLPILSNTTYFPATHSEGIRIDWGDGTITSLNATSGDAGNTHTYASFGTYLVRISGKLYQFGLGETAWTSGRNYLTKCLSFGTGLGLVSLYGAFRDGADALAVPKYLPNSITTMRSMFAYCSGNNFNPDVSQWNTGSVTDMRYMFDYCSGNNFNPDVSQWNTGSVTDMRTMFSNCYGNNFKPDVSQWNTSSVTNMRTMFSNCYGNNFNPDVSNWNVNNVSDMTSIFYNCSGANFNGGRGVSGTGIASWQLRQAGVDCTSFMASAKVQPDSYMDAILNAWANRHTLGLLPLNVTIAFPANQPYNGSVSGASLALLTKATAEGGAGWTISTLIDTGE